VEEGGRGGGDRQKGRNLREDRRRDKAGKERGGEGEVRTKEKVANRWSRRDECGGTEKWRREKGG